MFPRLTADVLMKLAMLGEAIPEDGTKEEQMLAFNRMSKKFDQMPKEHHITLHSYWQKILMETLCKQHGLRNYRYPKQKNTTIMIWVSAAYMESVLWPQYIKYSELLQDHINDHVKVLLERIQREVPKKSGDMQESHAEIAQLS